MRIGKIISTTLNIITSLYFFLVANFYFWGGIFLLVYRSAQTEHSIPKFVHILVQMALAPFLVYGAILFFRKDNLKFKFGTIMLILLFLEVQFYRLFFVTNFSFETADLTNFLLFGIPIFVVLISRELS